VGFQRNGEFRPFGSVIDGVYMQGWLDREALALVRDETHKPISYHDAVLEVWHVRFVGCGEEYEPWHPVTYAQVHEHNVQADT